MMWAIAYGVMAVIVAVWASSIETVHDAFAAPWAKWAANIFVGATWPVVIGVKLLHRIL